MKILHINFADSIGGAAIAVRRLHLSLLDRGYNSHLLVHEKNTSYKNIFNSNSNISLIKNLIFQSIERKLLSFIDRDPLTSNSLNIFPTGFSKTINDFNADVVNLHWIGNSLISIKEISKIKSKIVWTMHDMWPFSCTDHLNNDRSYIDKEFFSSKRKKISFLEKYVWSQKKKYFKNLDLKIICSSKWMFEEVSKSYLFGSKKIKLLPIILGDKKKISFDRNLSKSMFSFDKDKYLICNISENLNKPNKRVQELVNCIDNNSFFNKSNTEIVLVGEFKKKFKSNKEINIHHIGKLNDEISKKMLLSSMDVLTSSSQIETFGQVVLEALNEGVPCVIFENLGSSDLITHKNNGYNVQKDNFDDFSRGLSWVLTNLRDKKNKIKDNFNLNFNEDLIIKNYINFIKP